MLRVTSVLVSIAMLLPVAALADSREAVAVLELENQSSRIKVGEVQFLTDMVRQAARTGMDSSRFRVMTRETMQVMLPAGEMKCLAGECLVEIGKRLQARFVVGGGVKDFGSTIAITLEAYDAKTGMLVGSETGRAANVDQVGSLIEQVGSRLIGQFSGGETRTVVATPEGGRPVRVAEGLDPRLKVTEAQWRRMVSTIGPERIRSYAEDYQDDSRETEAAGWSAELMPTFVERTRGRFKQHRNGGMGTTITGMVIVTIGAIVGGKYIPSDNSGDHNVGIITLSAMAGVGGFLVLIGAPIWGVYQTRINDLDDAMVDSSGSSKLSLHWTGLTPIYDPARGTQGVASGFSF